MPLYCLSSGLLLATRLPSPRYQVKLQKPQKMLSSRAASLARRRSLCLLCRWQASDVQLSQQDVALLAAGSPEGPLTVTLQVPAQQLIATIVTSPAAEGPKYSLEAESRKAEGVSTAEPGASTSGEQGSRPPSPEQHPPKSLQPLLDHVCNRSLRPRVWQGEAMMPTPEQLDAAERELQYAPKPSSIQCDPSFEDCISSPPSRASCPSPPEINLRAKQASEQHILSMSPTSCFHTYLHHRSHHRCILSYPMVCMPVKERSLCSISAVEGLPEALADQSMSSTSGCMNPSGCSDGFMYVKTRLLTALVHAAHSLAHLAVELQNSGLH